MPLHCRFPERWIPAFSFFDSGRLALVETRYDGLSYNSKRELMKNGFFGPILVRKLAIHASATKYVSRWDMIALMVSTINSRWQHQRSPFGSAASSSRNDLHLFLIGVNQHVAKDDNAASEDAFADTSTYEHASSGLRRTIRVDRRYECCPRGRSMELFFA